MNESKSNSETGCKLIEEIANSNENKLESTSENDETESVTQPKPAASKRAYLEVNESVDKYKSFILKQLETKRLKSSETLSRVRDFLPLFKESTSKLLDTFKENPDELNIENVQEDEEHIEMNLAVVSDDSDDSDDDNDDDDEVEESEDGSTDENTSDEEDSSNKPLDEINLGIKVKNPTSLTKLKLTTSSNKKKPIIDIMDEQPNHSNSHKSDDDEE